MHIAHRGNNIRCIWERLNFWILLLIQIYCQRMTMVVVFVFACVSVYVGSDRKFGIHICEFGHFLLILFILIWLHNKSEKDLPYAYNIFCSDLSTYIIENHEHFKWCVVLPISANQQIGTTLRFYIEFPLTSCLFLFWMGSEQEKGLS